MADETWAVVGWSPHATLTTDGRLHLAVDLEGYGGRSMVVNLLVRPDQYTIERNAGEESDETRSEE